MIEVCEKCGSSDFSIARNMIATRQCDCGHAWIPTKSSRKNLLLQFFKYEHLNTEMQTVSKPFCDLAYKIVESLPESPEKTVALRKLLEAKDCAVRAFIFKDE